MLAHAPWVRRLARSMVAGPDVDDVMQQTWLAALEKPPRGPILSLKAWLGGVARRIVRDRNRAERRQKQRERRVQPTGDLPSARELVERAELHRRVVEAVLGLREPYRSALLLCFFEDRPADDVSAHLGIPSSTVRNRVRRGVELLRRQFLEDPELYPGQRNRNLAGLVALAGAGPGGTTAFLAGAGTSGGSAMSGMSGVSVKGLLAALGVALGAGVGGLLWGTSGSGALTASRALASPGSGPDPTVGTQAAPVAPVRKAWEEHLVAGRVTDRDGVPIPLVGVFVGGQPSPFDTGDLRVIRVSGPEPLREEELVLDPATATAADLRARGLVAGRVVRSDAEGRFEARLSGPSHVYVVVAESFGIRPVQGSGGWMDTPVREVSLRADRLPVARVAVSLLDTTTGRKLPHAGAIYRQDSNDRRPRVLRWRYDAGDTVEEVLELPSQEPTRFLVKLWEPYFAAQELPFLLAPGEERSIELVTETGEGFHGRVSGPDGSPLAGAVVFWGSQRRMRGEWDWSPFKPFDVPDAVRTDAEGRFSLPGRAEVVTAWHAEASPVTLDTAEAEHISLPPRAHLTGVLTDAAGKPMPGVKIELDQLHLTETDEAGRFRFDSIEAAEHCVAPVLPRDRGDSWHRTGVALQPDETRHIEIGLSVSRREVRLHAGGQPYTGDRSGYMVGLAPVHTLNRYSIQDGVAEVEGTRPGPYVLLSRQGPSSVVDLSAADPVVELGSCRLDVVAAPGTAVYLMPEWLETAHTFAREMARNQRWVVPAEGRVSYPVLPAGRYHVCTWDGKVVAVEVRDAVTEVRLEE